jgi:hypothetical protein
MYFWNGERSPVDAMFFAVGFVAVSTAVLDGIGSGALANSANLAPFSPEVSAGRPALVTSPGGIVRHWASITPPRTPLATGF